MLSAAQWTIAEILPSSSSPFVSSATLALIRSSAANWRSLTSANQRDLSRQSGTVARTTFVCTSDGATARGSAS